jgi:1,4-alpha-glucan branching enzyme
LIEGRLEDPTLVLGPRAVEHSGRRAMSVRAFLPDTRQAWVVDPLQAVQHPMRRIHLAGLYEAICDMPTQSNQKYLLRSVDQNGKQSTAHDPYQFPPQLTDFDLYLLGEGRHWKSYERLGAQLRVIDNVPGVNFAVWAPNAMGVSLVGDFNNWDGRRHPMRKHPNGIWELFVPGLSEGTIYKYQVRQRWGEVVDKADPYGFAAELPPRTASKVIDLERFRWNDTNWMANREKTNGLDAPMLVYEVHLGSWRRPGDDPQRWMSYRELAHQLVDYCREMGYTHIELLPVSEHPFTGSWGYQTTGYYAATSRYGSPHDFMYFVDHCHQNGLGVILDWVPAHFPKDNFALRRFDGTALYEHEDPRQGEHPDWGTLIFNYGRNEVRNFLLSNALFWLDKYHIDGLRVDAVASMLYLDYSRNEGEWIPNQYGGRENLEAISFLKEFNEQVHLQYPGALTIAEESTAWGGVSRPTYTGGLGFSLKWNMGWMNDTLRFMRHESIHRKYHHNELTFSENFALPLSHDEVVHGKRSLLDQMPGDLWQKFANLRLLYSYMWTHPGKKMLFMGSDIAQWHEWNHDESLQWHLLEWESHQGVQRLVRDLNNLVRREPALHQVDFDVHGFEWIDCNDWEESVLCYLRRGKNPKDYLVVACNFTPVPRLNHRIGVPELGWYQEVFNSDSQFYGGSNVGNFPGRQADAIPWHGRPYSIEAVVPPLGVAVFKPGKV